MANYDREAAWEIVNENIKGESLLKHCLTVESVMRRFAEVYGEDKDEWGIIGLLHDIDFEKYPEQHCKKTRGILESRGWPEKYIRAAESHGYKLVTDVLPVTNAEKVLYTIDELSGLIFAAALMRPSRSLEDLEAKSVKKKLKQKGFAANVNREVIEDGMQMMGMDPDEVITYTIEGMRPLGKLLGLNETA
jgi:putative nucleotidyltransferase with HDIG domain